MIAFKQASGGTLVVVDQVSDLLKAWEQPHGLVPAPNEKVGESKPAHDGTHVSNGMAWSEVLEGILKTADTSRIVASPEMSLSEPED